MICDGFPHEFMVKVRHSFTWGAVEVSDEMVDSGEDIVYERLALIGLFVYGSAIHYKQCIHYPPPPRRRQIFIHNQCRCVIHHYGWRDNGTGVVKMVDLLIVDISPISTMIPRPMMDR